MRLVSADCARPQWHHFVVLLVCAVSLACRMSQRRCSLAGSADTRKHTSGDRERYFRGRRCVLDTVGPAIAAHFLFATSTTSKSLSNEG